MSSFELFLEVNVGECDIIEYLEGMGWEMHRHVSLFVQTLRSRKNYLGLWLVMAPTDDVVTCVYVEHGKSTR